MNILIKKGSPIPSQAHKNEDAGYDLISTEEPNIIGEYISFPDSQIKYYNRIDTIQYKTNLFYSPQPEFLIRKIAENSNGNYIDEWVNVDYHTHILQRSSIWKTSLMLATGVSTIDVGYTGEIILNFRYISQPEDFISFEGNFYITINKNRIYKMGDKIAQLVVFPTIRAEFVPVDELPSTKRESKGFGSSGN